jgi:hypothetical protein
VFSFQSPREYIWTKKITSFNFRIEIQCNSGLRKEFQTKNWIRTFLWKWRETVWHRIGEPNLCVASLAKNSPHSITTEACKNDICLVQFSSVSILPTYENSTHEKRTTKLFFSRHKSVLIPHSCSRAMTLFVHPSCCSYSSLNGILLKQILARMFVIAAQYH